MRSTWVVSPPRGLPSVARTLRQGRGKVPARHRREDGADGDGRQARLAQGGRGLIERGYDINATNKRGATLHDVATATIARRRVLLEHGADRTIKSTDRRTAADIARSTGNYDLAAYIDGINSAALCSTPPARGTAEAIFLRCSRVATPKYRDEFQHTVLMLMSMYHDWGDAAAALIERGATWTGRA